MISVKDKIILLLPPKTGSTSLRTCFTMSNVKFDVPIIKPDFPYYHLTLSELLLYHSIKINEIKNYKIIQITRNPYDRFISAWKHHNRLTKKNISLDTIIKDLVENYHLLLNNNDLFYVNFYGSINHKEAAFKKNNWGGIRFWYAQSWWNDLDANVHHYKLEDLSKNTDHLSDLIGISLKQLPHMRQGNISYNDYSSCFTSNVKNFINEKYTEDIIKFEYSIL
jgi:hypothetical protein